MSGAGDNPFLSEIAAQQYAAGRLNVHGEFVRRVASRIGPVPVSRALDIGCGTGLSTSALLPVASRVVGVEPAAAMAAAAARRLGLLCVRGRGEALPFGKGSFGLVTMACASHWCEPVALLAEIQRVLRPGGHLAVYDHHLVGEMEGKPRFAKWFSAYRDRMPSPPRFPEFDPADLPEFRFVASERFEHLVELSLAELVRYICSQSYVLAAVDSCHTTMDAVEGELRAEIRPFFGAAPSARLVYRGVLDVVAVS